MRHSLVRLYEHHYRALGLSPRASLAEVKDRYRVLARQWHPDAHPPHRKEHAQEMFRQVHEAYRGIQERGDGAQTNTTSSWAQTNTASSQAYHGFHSNFEAGRKEPYYTHRRDPFHGEYGLTRGNLVLLITGLLFVGSIMGAWPYFLAKKNHMHLVRHGNRVFMVPESALEEFTDESSEVLEGGGLESASAELPEHIKREEVDDMQRMWK